MQNTSIAINVAANGRMVLPAKVRKAMGIEGETQIFLKLDGDQVRLETMHDRVRRVQEYYKKHVKHPSTVDDFIAERRVEAAREDADVACDDKR